MKYSRFSTIFRATMTYAKTKKRSFAISIAICLALISRSCHGDQGRSIKNSPSKQSGAPSLTPETMCTQFNKLNSFATAFPLDLNENDEDHDTSDFVVAIKKMFSIDGGVTYEYVKNTIELWAGMLLHPVCFFEGTNSEAE